MHSDRRLLFSLAWLGVLAAGCSDGGRAATASRTVDDPLCPLCGPAAGGDSSDFGGGHSGCSSDPPRALPADEAAALLDEARAMLRTFEASVGWTKEIANGHEAPDTEFSPAVLRASVEPSGEPERIHVYPADDLVTGCEDYLRIPIRLSVEISDGTLRAELSGYLWSERDGLPWTLQAHGDLAEATGTLDLDLKKDGSLPESGRVSAYWRYLDQFTGTLGISGLYRRRFADPSYPHASLVDAGAAGWCVNDAGPSCPRCATGDADCEAGPPPGFVDELVPEALEPTAHFPFGRCPGGSLAVEHDAPQDWLGGESAKTVFERARNAINMRAPVPAAWCHEATTDVSVEIGELVPETVCRERTFAFSFLFDGHAQSADRQLNETFELGSIAVLPESHQLENFALGYASGDPAGLGFQWGSDGQLAPRGTWYQWGEDYEWLGCLRWSDREEDACRCPD